MAASMSIGGAQVVRADEPIVATAPPPVTAPVTETAAPPVVEASEPGPVAVEEPVVAVGLPPVPPAVAPSTVVVAVGLPPVPTHLAVDTEGGGEPSPDAVLDASDVGSAVAGSLVAAALAGLRGA